MSESLVGSGEEDNITVAKKRHQDALALAFTAALVAFVGAVVVLTIPYALLSAPLPPEVNPLGISVLAGRGLFFGRVWYLLIPSVLFAAWLGYKFYQWGVRVSSVSEKE